MNRRIAAVCSALLLSALVASACGNDSGPGNASDPSQTGTSSPSPSASPASSPSSSPSASPASSPSSSPAASPDPETPEPSPSESAPSAEVPKTYQMNKNYFIVPIDKEVTERKVVLLTFDDGPKAPETLDPLLDTLDEHRAKAIFFVNGYRVKAHPELLKTIDERGQTIGNHSWDHIELKKAKPAEIKKQIESVQEIVEETIGKKPIFFRPPHGSSNDYVREVAKDNGMLFMTWSNGSLDWDMGKIPEEKRPQAIIDNVFEQLHPGSNILMHELPWTAKALDELLTRLEKEGYSFVDPNAIETSST